MELSFEVTYKNTKIRAAVKRPVTTKFNLFVDNKPIAESSRPSTTDLLCGILTWFGKKPKWELAGKAFINGIECEILAIHFTTFTRQYVEIYVNGEFIGPEAKVSV